MSGDITSLTELAPYVSVGATFKVSRDGGSTWEYVKIVHAAVEPFSDGGCGYMANGELLPGDAPYSSALTDLDFSRGAIVRVATAQEVKGKKWSYE